MDVPARWTPQAVAGGWVVGKRYRCSPECLLGRSETGILTSAQHYGNTLAGSTSGAARETPCD